jgi:hypothetical protein
MRLGVAPSRVLFLSSDSNVMYGRELTIFSKQQLIYPQLARQEFRQ